jgi:hypothetical protein
MNNMTIFPKKQYYFLLFSMAALLFFLSLDVIVRVKDYSLFLLWVEQNGDSVSSYTEAKQFSMYMTANLSYYVIKSIIPILFSLQSYFAYIKTRISNIYLVVWGILIVGSFVYHILEFHFGSILYYCIIITYLIIIGTLISLYNEINN